MDSIKPPVSQQESWHGDKLHSLLRICRKINSERDLAAVLDLIAREATKLVEADRSSIFLLDQEKRTLWSQVTQDGETIQLDARLGLAGAVVMTGQTINVIDAYNDPRFYKEIDVKTGFQTHSVLAVPLRNREGEVIVALPQKCPYSLTVMSNEFSYKIHRVEPMLTLLTVVRLPC